MNDILVTTVDGTPFSLTAPDPDEIRIKDISTALANTCRFGGRISSFYSTAQHSILCATHVPQEYRLWALLHDSAEAYIGDWVTPMKAAVPLIKEMEDVILRVIIEKHGLEWPMPEAVKAVDRRATVTERNFFYKNYSNSHWNGWEDATPFPGDIFPLGPRTARAVFTEWYLALTSERDFTDV